MIEHGPLIERLLAGEFICAVSDESAFRRLQDEEIREQLDAYLRPLNRRLAFNSDGRCISWPGVSLTRPPASNSRASWRIPWQACCPCWSGCSWCKRPGTRRPGRPRRCAQARRLQLALSRTIGPASVSNPGHRPLLRLPERSARCPAQAGLQALKEHGYLLQPHADRRFRGYRQARLPGRPSALHPRRGKPARGRDGPGESGEPARVAATPTPWKVA